MYSDHMAGCNVLFGDASVHFVSELVSPIIWSAMSTRAGHEIVSDNYGN